MATTVTTWNKGKAPAGATGWNLTPDVRAGLESMNVIVPVSSLAEMEGITPPLGKYAGMVCCRTDLPGAPLFIWDGTTWSRGVAPHQEFTYSTPVGNIPNNQNWGPGVLSADPGAVTTDNTLATHPADDNLIIAKAGEYSLWFGGAFGNGLTGTSWFQIKKGDDTEVYASGPANDFWGHVSIPNFRILTDNTTLKFRIKQNSGGTNNSSGRIRITKIS